MPHELVLLLDVDNTLLDNDGVVDDLGRYLDAHFGPLQARDYWACFEAVRSELGYADYLGAVQRWRLQLSADAMNDPPLLQLAAFLLDYPFADRLYAGALRAIAHLRQFGPTVILSDGDAVFQPRKVQRSGLWQAVEGRVLIYVHKERMLDALQRRFPARHYVMVDDKLRVLDAMKTILGERLTTVFPRQGHYALDPAVVAQYPAADVTLARIGELADMDLAALLSGNRRNPPAPEKGSP